MVASPVATVHQGLVEALDELRASVGTGGATDDDLFAALRSCGGVLRRVEVITVDAIATLVRRGAFAERGYRSAASALVDLTGCEPFEACRRVTAAEHIRPRIGLVGDVLEPRLPTTAAVFDDGQISLRHVEVIAGALATPEATRLTPGQWAGVEAELAEKAALYPPKDLLDYATKLVSALDQDGAEPDDRPPAAVNELHLHRNTGTPGGTIKGRFDDAALFDAIATTIDAHSAPTTADDHHTVPQRQAEAPADICGFVLDHGESPECGGQRPHLNVLIELDELENRAQRATLDFGGTLTPGHAADVGLRRRSHPHRAGRCGSTPRCGASGPHYPRRPSPRGLRPRPGLRSMRATPILVRNSPYSRVGTGWGHKAGQLHRAVSPMPPPGPPRRLGRTPHQRDPGVYPANVDRPATKPQTKTLIGSAGHDLMAGHIHQWPE